MDANIERKEQIAKPGCCEEASTLSHAFYIPCNKPATKVIFSKSDNRELLMCDACADHSVRNRGMKFLRPFEWAPPPIGDNSRKRDLREQLAEDHAQLRHDVETLAGRANVGPKIIASPADLDAVGKLVVDARALWKKVDKTRETEKSPHLQAGRDVDAHFSVLLDRLKRIGDAFQKIGDEHQREVAAEKRRQAEAEARALREEEDRQREIAQRAADADRPKVADKHEAKAEDLGERAAQAEAAAGAKAADLVRTRTDSGVSASASTKWVGTISDWAALDVVAITPYIKREALEAAVNQAVRMGVRSIKGVDIRQDTKATFR
jgi:hypothetical protein